MSSAISGPGGMDVTAARVRDEEEIRAVEAAYDAAWDAGDLAGLLALLAADVVVVNPFGETTAGRDDFGRSLTSLVASGASGSRHRSRIIGIRFVTDDVAVLDGEATIEGVPPAVAGGNGPMVHRYTELFVRRDGVWRIAQIRAYVHMSRP